MKNSKYIVLGLLLLGALTAQARTYVAGEKVYINADQSSHGSINWSDGNANLFLYFFQSTNTANNEWVSLSRVGTSDVFEGTMAPNHPWYDRVSVIRKSPTGTSYNWSDRWHQTCDIEIRDNNDGYNANYLDGFYPKSNLNDNCTVSYTWLIYAPPASTIPSAATIESSGVTMEHIRVCPSALGGPFSLRAKLNSDKTAYVYSDIQGHGWYISTDGNSWAEVQAGKTGVAASDLDGAKDHNTNELPAGPLTDIYYYLHSNIPSGRRLIHITTDAPKCDLDCSITSFETAVSNVNADDNTYTLDGIIAFGQASGNLVVSCGTNSLTIPSPKSPQAFSMHNLPATSTAGLKTTVQAYFDGDPSNCSKEQEFDVPNVVELVEIIQKDILTGDELLLESPTAESDNYFVWVDDQDTEYDSDTRPVQTWTIPAARFTTDETAYYTYREYYNLDGNMNDLMANGNYEGSFDYGIYGETSTISDYDFWGKFSQTDATQINFYTNSTINPLGKTENGFAVVKNANKFYPTYASVTAKEGEYFALFDAATGAGGGNKKAWYATTSGSSSLKLKKGTRYVLSFWAANINNYGEMDNAARFKFYIEDISDPANPVRIDSSGVLDLSIPEFRNNIWHQCSETFYVKKDYNNVRISVVNLNTNTLNVGNDFALDDIQFHAISTVTRAVKSTQTFKVVAHKPKIDAFTATVVPLACNGGPSYTVKMHVTFQNPKGQLIIKDETTGIEYKYSVTKDAWDTPKDFDTDIIISTAELSHNWTAYFENWPTAQKTTTTDIPGFPKMTIKNHTLSTPGCTDITANITFDVDYTYQQGDLHYWVDNQADSSRTITTDKAQQSLTGLVYEGFNADGKQHKLHVKFDGTNSCEDSITFTAPFSPVLDKVQIVSDVPTMLTCSTPSYTVNVEVTTHFNPAGLGKNITLHYHNGVALKDTTIEATGKTTRIDNLPLFNMDDTIGFHKIYAELDGYTPVCPVSTSYTPPTLARITPNFDVNVGETACGVVNYMVSGTVSFDMIDGDLIVEYDDAHRDVITPTAGSHSVNFTIPGMIATGTGLKLNAWFSGSYTAACTVVSNPFDAPVVPIMAINSVTRDTEDCNLTTGVSFDVDYTYQQGELRYWVDEMAYQSMAITPKNASSLNSGTLYFSGFNADGKEHMLHIQFSGTNSCEDSVAFTAPLSQVISSVTVSGVPATILCDATGYTANVAVTMPYDATGKNIVLTYEGKDTTVAVSGNPTNVTLPLTTADATGLTVKARFSDAPASCETVSDAYAAPTRLSCIMDTVTICQGESYIWPVTGLTYGPFMTVGIDTIASISNVHDSLFVIVHPQPAISLIPIDTLYADVTEIRLPYVVTEGTPNKFVISLAGSDITLARCTVDTLVFSKPAGVTTGDYTVSVQAIDSNFTVCNTGTSMTIHVAGIPTVSSLTVTPIEVACGASAYMVDVHIAYSNPRGNIVLEDKTSGTIYSYPVPKAAYNTMQSLDSVVSIASMTPAVHNWEAYFIGWTSASASSVTPTVPSMLINSVTAAAADCNLTTSVTFDVDYTYQQGDLRYWVDEMAYQSMAITPKNASALNSDTLYFSGFNADGKEHMLHVQFSGTNSCEDSVAFTAPLSQVISSVAVTGVPATILCDEMSYNVQVSIQTPFDATGKNIVLSYEGISTTVAATGTTTTTTLSMTYADVSGLTISAAYSDAPGCPTTSNAYNAPTRWSCERDYKDICLGESYTWHGTSYSPTSAGTFGYNDHYDSLYLSVHAEPSVMMLPIEMICDDENQIRLPYAVTDGTPNLFDVTINGQSFSQAKGSTDTIVISRPASIPAGTYTALITVRDSLVSCYSTTQTSFTIAESEVMYRKWDDLIFIDNSNNLFTAYQWYENGIALSNETKQYLHNENGLPGTYFCRMITVTNDTIYTCELALDNIPRSRDVDTTPKVKSTTMYDSMGRVIKTTPHFGIFIVVEELDNGEIRTHKIAVYE